MGAEPQDINCLRCHAEQFTVVDQTTGLLRCDYCRNQWIDSRFIKLTETERFIQEQAKQPKITVDNTTDTDRQLMEMITGIATGGILTSAQGCLAGLGRVIRTVMIIAVLLVIISFVAAHIDWGALTSGQGLVWQ